MGRSFEIYEKHSYRMEFDSPEDLNDYLKDGRLNDDIHNLIKQNSDLDHNQGQSTLSINFERVLPPPDFLSESKKNVEVHPAAETPPEEMYVEKEAVNDNSPYPNQCLKMKNGSIKIVFKGEDVVLKDQSLLGLYYIRFILKYGENGVTFRQIESHQFEYNEIVENVQIIDENDFEEKDSDYNIDKLSDSSEFSPTQKTDKRTLKKVQEEIIDLMEKKKFYEEQADFEAIVDVEMKIQQYEDYIKKNTNIYGEIRNEDTEVTKIKRRVKKNIKKALNTIYEINPQCYNYLKKSFELNKDKNKCYYVPDPYIKWIFE